MSLIKKKLETYQKNIQEHKLKKPIIREDQNKEDQNKYKVWLKEYIHIENEIRKLNERISEYNHSTVIHTHLHLDPIILDINTDIEFEFIQWYESVSIKDRSEKIKRFIINGFTKIKST